MTVRLLDRNIPDGRDGTTARRRPKYGKSPGGDRLRSAEVVEAQALLRDGAARDGVVVDQAAEKRGQRHRPAARQVVSVEADGAGPVVNGEGLFGQDPAARHPVGRVGNLVTCHPLTCVVTSAANGDGLIRSRSVVE